MSSLLDAQGAVERWDDLTDRERDAAVARARGHDVRYTGRDDDRGGEGIYPAYWDDELQQVRAVPQYTTDIAAAWPLLLELAEEHMWPQRDAALVLPRSGGVEVAKVDGFRLKHRMTRKDEAPAAISKAYLKAVAND